jgi:hypothetical protein
MKTYDVWTMNGLVEVKAEGIRRITIDDKPIKIYFYIGDEVVAEFYTDHICGWTERKEE